MLLQDRTAIVTGAADPRGLGLATASLFAEHGATVAILDFDADRAQMAAADLAGGGHLGMACDIRDAGACDTAVNRALEQFGRIDVLVNNAGVNSPARFMDIDTAEYDRVLDTNLRGTFQMCQTVVPHMRKRKSGSIVNVASVAGQRGGGIFGGTHYSSSKAAVIGFSKALARELAPENIRVNAICPSFFDTDIMGDLRTDDLVETIVSAVPMGRGGRPEEFAGCALFLASDLSSYVTGTEIDVNGGSHIH